MMLSRPKVVLGWICYQIVTTFEALVRGGQRDVIIIMVVCVFFFLFKFQVGLSPVLIFRARSKVPDLL